MSLIQGKLAVQDCQITTYTWQPSTDPRAIVLILHGLGEHASRYEHFAEFLVQHKFAVYAHDHRGHGQTAQSTGLHGHFADQDGWNLVVHDVRAHVEHIKQTFPTQKLILMGHSMGSFITQEFLIRHGTLIDGAILSGTSGKPGPMSILGKYIARVERRFQGAQGRAYISDFLSTYLFNRPFKPLRTSADWLSRCEENVDRYLNDSLCQFNSSTQLWIDLLEGVAACANTRRQECIPHSLPIYLFSGSEDPVSGMGQGVKDLVKAYRAAGLNAVTYRLYEGGRHEMLNEVNREEVYTDTLHWLDEHL